MHDPYEDPAELLNTRQAADLAEVEPVTIRQWVYRGLLSIAKNKAGEELRNLRNQPLYWRLDVAKAEFRTRKRARRAA